MQIPSFCILQGHLRFLTTTASTSPWKLLWSLFLACHHAGAETDSRAREQGGLCVGDAKDCISAVGL